MSDRNLIRLTSIVFSIAVVAGSVCSAEPEPSSPHTQSGESNPLKDDYLQRKNVCVQQPRLRNELLERLKKDQQIRRNPEVLKFFAETSGKNRDITALDNPALQKMLRIDRDNKNWLKQVVKQHGWPGKTLVGTDGAHAAFLLVQHASLDLAFQKQCLMLMQHAPKGEVAAVEIAYLLDRVRLAEGKKQRYGTQVEMKYGKWIVRDVEDPCQLDQRRKEVGLPPIKDYLQSIQKLFDTPNKRDQNLKE